MRRNRIVLSGLAVLLAVLAGCTAQSETDASDRTGESDGGLFGLFDGGPTVEVPAGTSLVFELAETLSTDTNESGDRFTARLAGPVIVGDTEAFPSGAEVVGRVSEAVESGRVKGRASIRLTLTEIRTENGSYAVRTSDYHAVAESGTREDAAKIGAGAGIGAVVGAVLGGGDGAAKGAAIGGGGGTAVVLATKGEDIQLPAGTRITVVLNDPVDVSL